MVSGFAGRLEAFLKEEAGEYLRSIIKYEMDAQELTYIRDDVVDLYSTEELESAIDNSRMESLSVPMYESIYSGDHGDITCLVKCFEHVVEMNFVLDDGLGAIVALDVEALEESHQLVSQARKIVEEERE